MRRLRGFFSKQKSRLGKSRGWDDNGAEHDQEGPVYNSTVEGFSKMSSLSLPPI